MYNGQSVNSCVSHVDPVVTLSTTHTSGFHSSSTVNSPLVKIPITTLTTYPATQYLLEETTLQTKHESASAVKLLSSSGLTPVGVKGGG